jgi:hypothetical protein
MSFRANSENGPSWTSVFGEYSGQAVVANFATTSNHHPPFRKTHLEADEKGTERFRHPAGAAPLSSRANSLRLLDEFLGEPRKL